MILILIWYDWVYYGTIVDMTTTNGYDALYYYLVVRKKKVKFSMFLHEIECYTSTILSYLILFYLFSCWFSSLNCITTSSLTSSSSSIPFIFLTLALALALPLSMSYITTTTIATSLEGYEQYLENMSTASFSCWVMIISCYWSQWFERRRRRRSAW